MAKLEELDHENKTYYSMMGTPLNKPFRVHLEGEDMPESEGTGKLSANQRDWLLRTVNTTEEVLVKHLEDYREMATTVKNVDRMVVALVDPTIGLIPSIKSTVEALAKDTALIRGEVHALDQYTRNGLTTDVKAARKYAEELAIRVAGCEDDIVELRTEEAREEGTEQGKQHVTAVYNRRRDDKYKTLTIAVSVVAVVVTVSLFVIDKL